jgi:hypothetical protein
VLLDSLRAELRGEWRMSRIFALHLKGCTLLYRRVPQIEFAFSPGPRSEVEGDLAVGDVAPVVASSVAASVAISGEYLNAAFGAGYGYRSLPILDLTLNDPGLIVDFDFFVRF